MHIANIMLSRGLGGIEQCAVDYAEALSRQNIHVTNIISKGAKIRTAFTAFPSTTIEIRQYGAWDGYAKRFLFYLLSRVKPDAIIAHGNRALHLAKKCRSLAPLVGITHNESVAALVHADAVLALTHHLKHLLIRHHVIPQRIYRFANMVRVPGAFPSRPPYHHPPVIGTMGRMVKKKGFDTFLASLAVLKQKQIPFQAIIAGDGEEKAHLMHYAATLGLHNEVTFPGWVKDKGAFFQGIDLFCLPSHHEPFGIILLEAFAHGVPVVVTDAEGPAEIITPATHALMVPRHGPAAMAEAMATLLANPTLAHTLATQAFALVQSGYDLKNQGKQLHLLLADICKQWQGTKLG